MTSMPLICYDSERFQNHYRSCSETFLNQYWILMLLWISSDADWLLATKNQILVDILIRGQSLDSFLFRRHPVWHGLTRGNAWWASTWIGSILIWNHIKWVQMDRSWRFWGKPSSVSLDWGDYAFTLWAQVRSRNSQDSSIFLMNGN